MRVDQLVPRYWVAYYVLYLVGIGVWSWVYWGKWDDGNILPWLASIFAVSAGGASAVAIVVEFGGRGVLLIPAAVRKLKEQGRVVGHEQGRVVGHEEGRVEGRQETLAEITAWFKRFQEAQAKGQEFTEPPPLE